jgi:hypothetical protein
VPVIFVLVLWASCRLDIEVQLQAIGRIVPAPQSEQPLPISETRGDASLSSHRLRWRVNVHNHFEELGHSRLAGALLLDDLQASVQAATGDNGSLPYKAIDVNQSTPSAVMAGSCVRSIRAAANLSQKRRKQGSTTEARPSAELQPVMGWERTTRSATYMS